MPAILAENNPTILTLFAIFALASTIALVALTMELKRQERKITTTLTKTILLCPSCGYTKSRKYKEGDYIGKELDENCPKCNTKLVVDLIYEEEITPKKKYKRPTQSPRKPYNS